MTCTFFGHRVVSEEIKDKLKSIVLNLIECYGVDLFYLGNNGEFDRLALSVLKELKQDFPKINYVIVLAYLNDKKSTELYKIGEKTLYPEGIECVPLRFAISKRNEWMIKNSDMVVTYVKWSGGAEKFKCLAEKMGKDIFEIS